MRGLSKNERHRKVKCNLSGAWICSGEEEEATLPRRYCEVDVA
jgi:hypothetical protein